MRPSVRRSVPAASRRPGASGRQRPSFSARGWGAIFWIAIASLFAACTEDDHSTGSSRMIVLVTIDTLRADHLSCYGYPRETSPFLDSMAAEGARFTRAVAACSHTAPAHASLFTGLSPVRHRVLRNGLGLRDEFDSMAELLQRAGYDTIAITSVGFLEGLSAGFDVFSKGEVQFSVGADVIARTTQALDERTRRGSTGPLFLWVHLFDVHTPYRSGETEYYRELEGAPEPERAAFAEWLVEEKGVEPAFFENGRKQMLWLANNYDAEIRTADRELKRLYDYMTANGHQEDALWVFVADHGEALGEHGFHGHDRYLYEEQLAIPLIVHRTRARAERRVVDQLVRHVDVLPTVLGWAGIERSENGLAEGRSLLPLIEGRVDEVPAEPAFSQRRSVEGKPDWIQESVYALRIGNRKYIQHGAGPDELFNLEQDPLERHNLVEVEAEAARQFNAALTELVGDWESAGLADPVLAGDGHLEELSELGYLDD